MSTVDDSRSTVYSADTTGRDGRITCQVIRSLIVDNGRVSYTILIRNDTGSDAAALAFIPDTLDLRHRKLVQSVVGPYSSFSTFVELDVARYGGIPELQIELSGEDIDFALIAQKAHVAGLDMHDNATRQSRALTAVIASSARNGVAQSKRRRTIAREDTYAPAPSRSARIISSARATARIETRGSPAALPMFVLFMIIMAAAGIAIARPQIREFTVPSRAQALQSIPIRYCATGIGTVTYRVVGSDGKSMMSESPASGCQTFSVTFPKADADRAYLIRVAIIGLLGTAVAENYVGVPAAPAPAKAAAKRTPDVIAPPQIRSLAIDRATVSGGETLNVYYDVAATSGNVALLDAGSQIAYGQSSLSATGHSAFVVPAVDTQRFLSVVLTAQRGAATAQSRVAITAEPQSSPTPAAGLDENDPSANHPTTHAPTIVAPKTVGSGQPIHIDVLNNDSDVVLTLSDAKGTQLARRVIRSPQETTVFLAPVVAVAQRVRMEATYAQGAGSETILQTIVVRPR